MLSGVLVTVTGEGYFLIENLKKAALMHPTFSDLSKEPVIK